MKLITPYPSAFFPFRMLLLVLALGVLPARGPADRADLYAEPARGMTLRLNSFPEDAELFTMDRRLEPDAQDGSWREYRYLEEDATLLLAAPGYRSRPLHLYGVSGTVTLEERLLPDEGPLVPAGEFATGGAPKSVLFLPDDRLAVPLLRDRGVDLFRWYRAEGAVRLDRLGPLRSAADPEDEIAFVEPLVLPERGELWVTRMEPDEVHRFSLESLRTIGFGRSGGVWPKVMVADRSETRVYVANWLTETITVLDAADGTVRETIPVGGQPRGMWFSPRDGLLWVCLFSTGDIEIIDPRYNRVIDRLGLPAGAARHIVGTPEGDLVYYSDMFHGTVSIIDTARRRVVRSRRVGPNVNTIVLDPAGRYLFASVRGSNNRENYLLPGPEHGRIVVLDAESLEPVQTLWGRRQPTGLAVSPDGTLLAATDFLDDNLSLFEISREHPRLR